MKRKPRIIIARLGLDAHWRGSVVVARALRDAGMEVIYLGNQMPEAIVRTALHEDPDVIGLSSLSGNHMVLAPLVLEGLRHAGMGDTPVVLGGTVPPDDVAALKAAGIAGVFGPGSSLQEIEAFVAGCAGEQQSGAAEKSPVADRAAASAVRTLHEGGVR